jgi:DNA-binding transcriptional regulator GbsR (MarR family)
MKFSENEAKTRICSGEISGTGSTYGPLKSIGQLFGKLDVKNAIVNEGEFNKATLVLKAFVGQPGVPDSAKSNPLTLKELETAEQLDEKSEMEAALKRLSKAFHINQKFITKIIRPM